MTDSASEQSASEQSSSETLRAGLLLSNRLTNVGVAPLKAREFWALLDRVEAAGSDLAGLAGDGALLDAVAAADVSADRVSALLDATRAMAFEIERLGEGGIELVSALDERFPPLLRTRMSHGCPPHLFAAGDVDHLSNRSLSIIGEPDESQRRHEQVRQAVAAAVVAGWNVVTPTADTSPNSVGDIAGTVIDEAVACDAALVLVADDGINRVARQPDLRRLVQARQVCLISPFAPDDAASAATTRARDAIVHATATLTLVMGCNDGTGSIWASMFGPVSNEPTSIATIVDDQSPAGNRALCTFGAHELTTIDDLHTLLE